MGSENTPLAAFDIEGPDDDGFVWLCDEKGHRCFNLGWKDEVAEQMRKWLGSIEHSGAA